MYYTSEIYKLLKNGKSDEQIMEYFNLPFINKEYIKIVKAFYNAYNKTYTKTFLKKVNNVPPINSPLRPVYDAIILYGEDNFKKLLNTCTHRQIAEKLNQPKIKVTRFLFRRYLAERRYDDETGRARYKPKYLRGAKSFSEYLKRKNKRKIPNMQDLLDAF
jgi:hypothetical protein